MSERPQSDAVQFSTGDRILLQRALAMAASRLEAYARHYPRSARKHDKAAAAMRALRSRLCNGGNA